MGKQELGPKPASRYIGGVQHSGASHFLERDFLARVVEGSSEGPRSTPPGLRRFIGHDGEQNGAVYTITVGRNGLKLTEMGAAINSRMGLNTWAAFYGTNEDAAVAGDVAMLEDEVTPTLKALRSRGLDVVAIHHHMIGTTPVVIFLHYWGRGPADKLAAGFTAALDQSGRGGRQ
jgi:hypothetical protein